MKVGDVVRSKPWRGHHLCRLWIVLKAPDLLDQIYVLSVEHGFTTHLNKDMLDVFYKS